MHRNDMNNIYNKFMYLFRNLCRKLDTIYSRNREEQLHNEHSVTEDDLRWNKYNSIVLTFIESIVIAV